MVFSSAATESKCGFMTDGKKERFVGTTTNGCESLRSVRKRRIARYEKSDILVTLLTVW